MSKITKLKLVKFPCGKFLAISPEDAIPESARYYTSIEVAESALGFFVGEEARKLREIKHVVDSVPGNWGEQFIHVNMTALDTRCIDVKYGLQFKRQMGTIECDSLEKTLEAVKSIALKANMVDISKEREQI